MAFEDYAPVLKTKIGELAGLETVFDYQDMPSTLGPFPSAVIQPVRGDFEYAPNSGSKDFDFIAIAIYTMGSLGAEGLKLAVPFIIRMRDKLAANMTLDGTVEHIIPASPTYEGPGQMRYGGKEGLVGIKFNYEVKVDSTGDFTVSA